MEPTTLGWLLDKAWLVLGALVWYGKKNLDSENKARDAAIAQLEKHHVAARGTYITEAQMKEAIKEALMPYREDSQEIKLLLNGLTEQIVTLSRDMAVQNAIRSLANDQQNNVGR